MPRDEMAQDYYTVAQVCEILGRTTPNEIRAATALLEYHKQLDTVLGMRVVRRKNVGTCVGRIVDAALKGIGKAKRKKPCRANGGR